MLATSLFVVHDTSRGGQNQVTELTRGQEVGGPFLKISKLNVEAGRNHTALVQAAVELDDNLARTVVINFLKLANVAYEVRMFVSCHIPRDLDK